MRALVEVVENKHNFKWWWAMLLVLGMFSMNMLASISQHMCFTLSQKVGMKLRSTVIMEVYNKLLSTRLVTLVGTNSGFMLNLITNDTQKILDATQYFHFVWFTIIEIGTISTLAITEVGASAFPGVIVAFLTQPLQLWMAHLGARLRIKAVKYTDSRVHLTEEILNGIRVIKYNGWVAPFLHRIAELRRNEMYSIKKASFIRAACSTIRDSVTPLASLVTFGTYLAIHKGNFMSPSQAFTVLALFSILVRTFSIASTGFQACGEAVVGICRLQKLLNMDEVDNIASQQKKVCKDFPEKAVVVKNCTFCWRPRKKKIITNKGSGKVHLKAEKNIGTDSDNIKLDDSFSSRPNHLGANAILRNINFSIGKGELVAIFGAVGSGKSSLLLGLLGEMQCLTGRYFVRGNVAYVPQQPWILNDTLRQNIVFTSPFDPERYQKTIEACALEHDISQFPGGHDTEIGNASVRAYGTCSKMHDILLSLVDANNRSYIMFMHMSRWIGVRLDCATGMCVTFASILVVILRHSTTPGLAGLVLVQSMQVSGYIQFAIRQAAEVENYLTSVERINAYANSTTEADPNTPSGIIDEDWPSRGEIEFLKYTMTYRVDLPPVLNEVSLKINASEKIGILGRTGVGKSSLAAALFRMVENERCSGDILIDGVNIKLVGLDDLRQRLSIIPQDPILFQGSVRFNLDPFEVYTDAEIYDALERVHLKEKIQTLDRGLDSQVVQNGENFSVGQRQLMCLARSLLRRSQIIVMDEATAAVDGETDTLIQKAIRNTFQNCTMVTIAHRIETVIDCDRVLILAEGGRVAEFDSPHKLLNCSNQGIFAEMVRQTGPSIAERLHKAAEDAEMRRREHQCIEE